jgi:phosphatidylglycerol:prolipoprotein diacylglycerol transferase
MLPILQIGPFSLRTPGLALLAGLWVALDAASREGQRGGIDGDKTYNLGFYALAAGVLGARLGFVLLNLPLYTGITPWKRAVGSALSPTPGTEAAWAGLLVGAGVAAYLIRRWELDPLTLADSFAPAFAIMGIGIGLANLLSGDLYGVETRLPWAINLWGAARHPTQVYLALACTANLAALRRLRSKGLPGVPGDSQLGDLAGRAAPRRQPSDRRRGAYLAGDRARHARRRVGRVRLSRAHCPIRWRLKAVRSSPARYIIESILLKMSRQGKDWSF